MKTYTTISGDHWDEIAKKVYGKELAADWLMQHNPSLVGIFRFDSGVVLNTPDLPEETTSILAPWR